MINAVFFRRYSLLPHLKLLGDFIEKIVTNLLVIIELVFHYRVEEDDSLYKKMEYWKTIGLRIKHSNDRGD